MENNSNKYYLSGNNGWEKVLNNSAGWNCVVCPNQERIFENIEPILLSGDGALWTILNGKAFFFGRNLSKTPIKSVENWKENWWIDDYIHSLWICENHTANDFIESESWEIEGNSLKLRIIEENSMKIHIFHENIVCKHSSRSKDSHRNFIMHTMDTNTSEIVLVWGILV